MLSNFFFVGLIILILWGLYRVTRDEDPESMDTPKSSPRDFFLHLFAFGTLYVSAISLISLWFQYINLQLPDPLQPYGYQPSSYYAFQQLRWPMSALIVVFPVFLFLTRWISGEIARDPSRKELRIYKWLVYLTLFVSSVTIVVDLVTLIYNFLGGELTARFGLKVVVVLVVALAIFGYYLWHLRSDLAVSAKKRLLLLWLSIVIMLGSIVLGFFFVGSPTKARAQKFDEQRISDLQQLQWQVINHWQQKGELPETLAVLQNDLNEYRVPLDPRTKMPYEYDRISPKSMVFTLCATFEQKGTGSSYGGPYPVYSSMAIEPPFEVGKGSWDHEAERTCFTRTIDPDMFPKPMQ